MYVTQPKRRTLKRLEDITITKPGQKNNGNIEVIDEEEHERLAYESLYINRKRYKVPSKIIQLDFWSKIGRGRAT